MTDKELKLKIEKRGKEIWKEMWENYKDNYKRGQESIDFITIIDKKFQSDISNVLDRIDIKNMSVDKDSDNSIKVDENLLKVLQVCSKEANKQLNKELEYEKDIERKGSTKKETKKDGVKR